MTWWLWGLLANACIVLIEFLNRKAGAVSYLEQLTVTAPLIFVAQMGLFYCWRDAPKMLLAWAVFTLGNCAFRLISVQWAVGEPPGWVTLAGVAMMIAGAFTVKAGG